MLGQVIHLYGHILFPHIFTLLPMPVQGREIPFKPFCEIFLYPYSSCF